MLPYRLPPTIILFYLAITLYSARSINFPFLSTDSPHPGYIKNFPIDYTVLPLPTTFKLLPSPNKTPKAHCLISLGFMIYHLNLPPLFPAHIVKHPYASKRVLTPIPHRPQPKIPSAKNTLYTDAATAWLAALDVRKLRLSKTDGFWASLPENQE